MSDWKKIPGGVLAPLDFVGGAAMCGIKTGEKTRYDLALVASSRPCVAAATFTTNKVKAAPVLVSSEHYRASKFHRAAVLNSGNANACTGSGGLEASRATAAAAAKKLGCSPEEVFVCSTGRIGRDLPTARIFAGIEEIELDRASGNACAKAIMTSDTVPKEIALKVGEGESSFRIGAMAKGAGMIDPNMATMLCLVSTDASVPASAFRKILREAVADSFNRITIDGDMSTNDTVIALANGASGAKPDLGLFARALSHVLRHLARAMVLDGEGVSKFVAVEVRGAASAADARRAAEAVANSTLVKCSWAGGDPNWGRILDAIGYCGAKFSPDRVDVDYGDLPVVRSGLAAPTPLARLKKAVAKDEFRIRIDLAAGPATYEVWTTDLTEEYVRLNLSE